MCHREIVTFSRGFSDIPQAGRGGSCIAGTSYALAKLGRRVRTPRWKSRPRRTILVVSEQTPRRNKQHAGYRAEAGRRQPRHRRGGHRLYPDRRQAPQGLHPAHGRRRVEADPSGPAGAGRHPQRPACGRRLRSGPGRLRAARGAERGAELL
ncbi:hypothetical protein CVT23_03540 [Minwuia thermotolerans]|uniref:Uncharacterized protein n=1 Tax=Minwuia thermotolerans TaxID=2056226 RepID=A0A2M9G5E7_9PROT|nr:hypothetical protein CVT23_03540 [Minwuia thermotolerans]